MDQNPGLLSVYYTTSLPLVILIPPKTGVGVFNLERPLNIFIILNLTVFL